MDSPPLDDHAAMGHALAEARAALEHDDVPVGVVVVKGGEIVGRGHNRREIDQDPTAHAEVIALRDAAGNLGRWRLDDCTMVVTLEPCAMCAGAIISARIARLVIGAADLKAGAVGSLYNLCDDPRLNHTVDIRWKLRETEAAELLTEFFAAKR